jgi:hypothetical protein
MTFIRSQISLNRPTVAGSTKPRCGNFMMLATRPAAPKVCAVGAKLHHDEDGFRSVDGIPSWHAMAVFCQDRSARLRGNEPDFVDDMVGWTTWREPRPKQQKWLRSIYAQLGGRLPP